MVDEKREAGRKRYPEDGGGGTHQHSDVSVSSTLPRLNLKEERPIWAHSFKETSALSYRVQREKMEVHSSVPGIVSTSQTPLQ